MTFASQPQELHLLAIEFVGTVLTGPVSSPQAVLGVAALCESLRIVKQSKASHNLKIGTAAHSQQATIMVHFAPMPGAMKSRQWKGILIEEFGFQLGKLRVGHEYSGFQMVDCTSSSSEEGWRIPASPS